MLQCLSKTMSKNSVSQDISQDIQKQNTLVKIIVKKRRPWDLKM